MNEIIQFISNLEDPVGKSIVQLIFIVFCVGVLNYLLHIIWLRIWERLNLKQVRTYITANHGLGNTSLELLNKLRTAKVSRFSIIYRRIRDFVEINQNGGHIDNDTFGDIHTAEASRKAALSSYILGILIILGLIGTLRGLITAIIEVQPLLRDIQDIDQLPTISDALRETLAGMNTAFVTTLVGLLTSLGLGFCGWIFNRENSKFLTDFERFVSTEILPHFTQAPESAIESNIAYLTECTDTLKLATKENVQAMRQAIQILTDTSWGGHLEQQYVLANNFGETSKNLLESLGSIYEHQALFKNTLDSFKELTAASISRIEGVVRSSEDLVASSMSKISEYQSAVEIFQESVATSMSQISGYQKALRDGLENAVPQLKAESEALKTTIREYQNSQATFVDKLAEELQKRLQSITDNQQNMVQELREIAGELNIRSALEEQNQVFEGLKAELINNQKATVETLLQLKNELSIRPILEAQNQVFGRIETHLEVQGESAAEQQKSIQTLDAGIKQLQQTFSSTALDGQQLTEKMLQQLLFNFDILNQKMDTLNYTMARPGLYRWGPEIRRWFRIFRK